MTSKKPKPESRPRDSRPHYHHSSYDRRGPPMDRSGAPMYSMYPPSGRGPYSVGPARGGYYGMGHMDNRRPQMPMQMEPPRYDPYRRPDFYDPYMMQRGGMPPAQPYYHHSAKMSSNNPNSSNNNPSSHSRNQAQPPVRYSNPYNRR